VELIGSENRGKQTELLSQLKHDSVEYSSPQILQKVELVVLFTIRGLFIVTSMGEFVKLFSTTTVQLGGENPSESKPNA
jgi:hypothetical protein